MDEVSTTCQKYNAYFIGGYAIYKTWKRSLSLQSANRDTDSMIDTLQDISVFLQEDCL